MNVKIDGRMVDVKDRQCAKRACFCLGFDKGTFTQGVGYTSYHAKERAVCWTRHLNGCPCSRVCPQCRTAYVDETRCDKCGCQTELGG